MAVQIEKIKKLREETGLGVSDCKAALEESNGDLARAKAILVKKGLKRAAKKAERATQQGIVEAYTHTTGKVGVIVQLLCETDFVARNEEFKKLAHEIALQVASMKPKEVKDLLKQTYIRDPKKKVGDLVKEAIGKIGENIVIKSFKRLEI